MYYIQKPRVRKRYIGFIVKTDLKETVLIKKDLFYEIKKICKDKFNKEYNELGLSLLRFDGYWGIIRCNHTQKEKTIEILNSIKKIKDNKVKIETLGTSGTIKTLIRKFKK